MILATISKDEKAEFQELRVDGRYVASVWGNPEVEPRLNRPGYHVTIRQNGLVSGFFHVDAVQYK